ncbi:maleylpyruvate isomerase family mycothiol-dependent enzyme [Corynebacterium sp. HMSC076D02]|uniref:maleylpyruvate isomerase family mycothiol-dependent enzyme n=1 Tax=Corynebacterium sp. HMSC076D02 TaxID=1739439 RepID=UPI00352B9059
MSFSSAERAKLVTLFHKLGPDAPTLCQGWSTRDLAAHLWVRENRPDAAAGMLVPQLAGRLDAAMEQAAARDFTELVDDWGGEPDAPTQCVLLTPRSISPSTLSTTRTCAAPMA